MKITMLAENTSINDNLKSQHGLSLYIETEKHKLLVDTGAGDLFLKNAAQLGIDISAVDTLIITHGHSDHGGGLKAFLEVNKTAKIYLQDTAFGKHFVKISKIIKVNIGLDEKLKNHPQIVFINGDYRIDDEIMLITDPKGKELLPKFNSTLWSKQGKHSAPDGFEHEQSIVLSGNKTVLIGGCAHRGIANILADAELKIQKPVDICVSGFHLYNPTTAATEDNDIIKSLASKLQDYNAKFYTCHCTGLKAYDVLKSIMTDKIEYLATGQTVECP